MSKLYIIGNGFDIAHKLPTKYENFHNFLKMSYKIDSVQGLKIPTTIEKYNKFITSDDEQASFLVNLIDRIIEINNPQKGTWEEFETYLGKIPYNDVFDNQSNNNVNHDDFLFSTLDWDKFFKEWITLVNNNCIENVKVNEPFKNSIDYDDLFFTTNYTSTLENKYNIQKDNICHIHGNIDNPKFGHNEELTLNLYDKNTKEIANHFHESLRKDSASMEEQNSKFFDKIKDTNINEIIIYGNSISKPDRYYFKRIFELKNSSKIVVRFTKYDELDEKRLNKKKNLLTNECGFTGKFEDPLF